MGAAHGIGWDSPWNYPVTMANKQVQQTQPERVTWPEVLSLLLLPGEPPRPAESLSESVMASTIYSFNLDPLAPQEDGD